VVLKLAASSFADGCIVFGAAHHYNEDTGLLVPAEFYAFDLRKGRARAVRTLTHDLARNGKSPAVTKLAISPAQRHAAVSLNPITGASARGIVVFADLAGKGREEAFDGRRATWLTGDLAFLSEDELLLSTRWAHVNTEAVLLDRRTKQLHSLCSPVFGEPELEKGNPRAVAVNAKLNLVAVALRDEVRAFRYRRNPHGRWRTKDCVDD
jgi:hypothetical protein